MLSKEKSIRWLPRFFILKPDLALHRGVNVLAMASMLRGRFVRNLAAMANFAIACSFPFIPSYLLLLTNALNLKNGKQVNWWSSDL